MKIVLLIIIIALIFSGSAIFGCTGIALRTASGVLVGNNEDYLDGYTDVVAWVQPAASGKYGCMTVGFGQQQFSMGGINEKGLFFDLFTVPSCAWSPDPNRLDYNGFLEPKMLAECANVQEALAFFLKYNNPNMGYSHYQIFVADRSGAAAVISWYGGDYEIVNKEAAFMVVTNFFQLHPEFGNFPCWRYATAVEMLQEARTFTSSLLRSILEKVNLGSNYSNICNLQSGEMLIYNNHNFEESIALNIYAEMAKGWQELALPPYFSKIKLALPAQGATCSPQEVVFGWEGKPDSQYSLLLSTDPDFLECQPLQVANWKRSAIRPLDGNPDGVLLLGFVFLPLFTGWRKKAMILSLFLLAIALFLVSCKSPAPELPATDVSDHSIRINNLQSNHTYYWKIRATQKADRFTESIIRMFTTGSGQ
jgi:hypothetical protein